jgi:N-acetylglucosaminyl-diphospho-decaprenol L-rhamnosyltransferase
MNRRPTATGIANIGVVIVAYNSAELIGDCILGALLDPQVSEVLVVDNSSDAASKRIVAELAETDGRVGYIDPGENIGFARGCNVGAKALAGVTHYFFVNPDVRLTRSLSPLATHMEQAGSAIVTARLESPDHPLSLNVRPIVTWRRELAKAVIGSRAYLDRHLKVDSWPAAGHSASVGQVDGALLGIRADTFDAMNGFDERFELYYEDVDICARARSEGGCLFVSELWGTHVGGASSGSVSTTAYQVGRVSRVRYLLKHYGESFPVKVAVATIAIVEFFSRSLTKQAEGLSVRGETVFMQFSELKDPGSVRLLTRVDVVR